MPSPRRAPAAPATRAVARRVIDRLAQLYPGATTELHYRTPFELLVATILSAQSTDRRVNEVTPVLFARYPDARALAAADPAELEGLIRPTGFFRQKTRTLLAVSKALLEQHGGEVPASMDALVALPGVGRKTANVVLGHALGVPGLPVDRHVLRVANRIGLATAPDPETVEQQLTSRLPQEMWTLASDVLILHGRRICRPRPLCDRCPVLPDCRYGRTAGIAQTRGEAARRPRSRPAPVSAVPNRGESMRAAAPARARKRS